MSQPHETPPETLRHELPPIPGHNLWPAGIAFLNRRQEGETIGTVAVVTNTGLLGPFAVVLLDSFDLNDPVGSEARANEQAMQVLLWVGSQPKGKAIPPASALFFTSAVPWSYLFLHTNPEIQEMQVVPEDIKALGLWVMDQLGAMWTTWNAVPRDTPQLTPPFFALAEAVDNGSPVAVGAGQGDVVAEVEAPTLDGGAQP